jgi:adenosylcobinamide-GDP ribazoletransferase
MKDPTPFNPGLGSLLDDLRPAFGFLTRLPVGGDTTGVAPDFRRIARVFPIVGAAIGILGGIVLLIAAWLGEPALLAALIAVAATVLITGGFHEDGLADTADGFGGGRSSEQKLDIMDDSRIGAYGALALIFSILIRVGALAALYPTGAFRTALALVAAEAASRAALVRLWYTLPAARQGGLSESAGAPDERSMLAALVIGLVIIVVTIIPAFGFAAAIVATLVLGIATFSFIRLSSSQIGGRTGDTLGACQQIAGAGFLFGLAPFA